MNRIVKEPAEPALDPSRSKVVIKAALNIATQVEAIRAQLTDQARELAEEYERRREELMLGFCSTNLVVQVRNEGRNVYIYWVKYHFRKGKRAGQTMLPKPKSSMHFDKGGLKRNSPEWIWDLLMEMEDRARPIREALAKLIEAERDVRVATQHLGLEIAEIQPGHQIAERAEQARQSEEAAQSGSDQDTPAPAVSQEDLFALPQTEDHQ